MVSHYYGSARINRLSFKPLKRVILSVLANIFFLVLFRVEFNLESCGHDHNIILSASVEVFHSLNAYMSSTFVLYCIFEWRVLWFFIYFQSSLPHEELEPKRLHYQRQEQRRLKTLSAIFWLFTAVFFLFFASRAYIMVTQTLEKRAVWVLMSLMILLACLFSYIGRTVLHTATVYLMTMRRLQRFEYRRHRNTVVILSALVSLSSIVTAVWLVNRAYLALAALTDFKLEPEPAK